MRRYFIMLLSALLFLTACGNSKSITTWQEQYDLGVRYLSEGNYEEAIIAFTAAIEIDPKKIPAYQSLASAYIEQGDFESAEKILEAGIAETSNQGLIQALDELRQLIEASTETPQESVEDAVVGSLDLRNVSCVYEHGGEITEYNEGAVGGMYINGTVHGPETVCDVYIATWYLDEYPSQNEIDESIKRMVDIWREDGEVYQKQAVPYEVGVGHPVDNDELGKTAHVLLIGLDANGNAAAYTIVTEQIPGR